MVQHLMFSSSNHTVNGFGNGFVMVAKDSFVVDVAPDKVWKTNMDSSRASFYNLKGS
jgi:hypothetical protein